MQRLDNVDKSLLMKTMADYFQYGSCAGCGCAVERIAASCVERLYLFCTTMTGLHCFELPDLISLSIQHEVEE